MTESDNSDDRLEQTDAGEPSKNVGWMSFEGGVEGAEPTTGNSAAVPSRVGLF